LLPIVLGGLLTLRVLLDRLSAPDSRHTASFGVSGAIAALFGALALAMLARTRSARRLTALVGAFLVAFTALALLSRGAHAATLREGIREGSVLALAAVVVSARTILTARVAARLVQLAGLLAALEALHQRLAGTGMLVGGAIRANGTFAHPNSAAMFFALGASASLWLFLDRRGTLDALATCLYTLALLTTFSIDGLVTLIAMLLLLALLSGPGRLQRLAPCALAALAAVAFVASPLGSQRIARESGTRLSAASPGSSNSSLSWRLYKWRTLVREWEGSPLLGKGLGSTTAEQESLAEPITAALPHNEYVRYLVETGLLGLLLLAAAVVALIRRLRVLRAATPTVRRGAELALVVLTGCLVNSLADNTLLNSPTCYAAALVLAAGAASHPRSRWKSDGAGGTVRP
jgi:O-antigen ligase